MRVRLFIFNSKKYEKVHPEFIGFFNFRLHFLFGCIITMELENARFHGKKCSKLCGMLWAS